MSHLWSPPVAGRCRPHLLLTLLWLAYCHPLVLAPASVLWGDFADFQAEHLPAKLFLNREWRSTCELPLWNPHHFCGTPFVHDIDWRVLAGGRRPRRPARRRSCWPSPSPALLVGGH